MLLRRQQESDTEPLRTLFGNVLSEAFFDRLHTSDVLVPELSFVAVPDAESDHEVVGHVAGARGRIGDTAALVLVPASVDSHHRGHGVGQALMHTILGAAESHDESLLGVVATPPDWYEQFGFRPGDEYSITPPVGGWKPYFLVRPLTAYDPSVTGTLEFPDAFGE